MAAGGKREGAGRPKGRRNKVTAEVKSIAQRYGEEAITNLVEIMRDVAVPPAARVAASKEILDRAYGKSTQPIAGDPSMPPVAVMPTTIELVAPDVESKD